jgi:His/Glu/Gln/Arg/opine family amino acid ABC transporter permease subunit
MALAGALAGCHAGGYSVPRRTLVVGTDATFPPLEFLQGGRFAGFDIDLGNAIGRELGADVQWVNCSFDGIFAALQAGKFDLVISSVTITPDRRKQMAFSEPYYTAGQALVSRRAGPIYSDMASLAGKTVGIQINTSAKEVLKKHPAVQCREYNSVDLALLDLQNGNVDAVMADSPVVRHMLHRGFPGLTVAGGLLTEERYGIAARPGSRELLAEVNASLGRIRARGEFAALQAKWFGKDAAQASGGSARELAPIVAPALARAAVVTIELTFAALLSGLPLGLLVALLRIGRWRPGRWIALVYIESLRGTPLLVQVFTVYYVLPAAGVQLGQWPAALLAFSLNSSAYVAEIFRAGIQSIETGQMEGARSLGMTRGMAMRLVILPQAARRVLPPLTNEAIALLKDTSLVSVIALVELTREGQQLTGSLAAPMVVWPMVGLFYLALTVPLTALAGALERRWGRHERH